MDNHSLKRKKELEEKKEKILNEQDIPWYKLKTLYLMIITGPILLVFSNFLIPNKIINSLILICIILLPFWETRYRQLKKMHRESSLLEIDEELKALDEKRSVKVETNIERKIDQAKTIQELDEIISEFNKYFFQAKFYLILSGILLFVYSFKLPFLLGLTLLAIGIASIMALYAFLTNRLKKNQSAILEKMELKRIELESGK